MPSSAVFAGVAASQAAIASAAAHSAEVSRCEIVVQHFDSQNTTVGQAQDYAGCINTLYPQPIGAGPEIFLKVLFSIAVLGLVGALTRAYRNRKLNDWDDWLIHSLVGFIAVPCIIGFVAGIAYGLYWLFT